VQLGCCVEKHRCRLCNPAPRSPLPETVAALIEATERDSGRPSIVAFFGGAPPSDALLDAIGDRPFLVRVRPDLLSRATARGLLDRGVRAIELDTLSFDDQATRVVRRRHKARISLEIAHWLADTPIRSGVVLAPGLPGTSFDTCLQDAALAAEHFDTARLHPVLVLDQADLRESHADGTYEPLTLGAAVTVCRAMADVLGGGGCEVIRIGAQPGPDELGRAVAGPRHSALGQLVAARRALDGARAALSQTRRGDRILLHCARAEETATRGPLNRNIRTLRAEFSLDELRVAPDEALPRGQWNVSALEATE
jgi:hypothetical protein